MTDSDIIIARMMYFTPDEKGEKKIEYFEDGYALNDFIDKMKKIARKNKSDFIYRISNFKCIDR